MSEIIFQKISMVMKDVSYLQKDGKVAFKSTKYNYLSEGKITAAIRESMVKHGLVMYPKKIEQLPSSEFLDELIVTYVIHDVASESFIEVQSKGSGQDKGDKKTYKALTGAFKYAQRQTFMISTGDDPDKQSTEENLSKIKKEKKSTPGSKTDFTSTKGSLSSKDLPSAAEVRIMDLYKVDRTYQELLAHGKDEGNKKVIAGLPAEVQERIRQAYLARLNEISTKDLADVHNLLDSASEEELELCWQSMQASLFKMSPKVQQKAKAYFESLISDSPLPF